MEWLQEELGLGDLVSPATSAAWEGYHRSLYPLLPGLGLDLALPASTVACRASPGLAATACRLTTTMGQEPLLHKQQSLGLIDGALWLLLSLPR